MKFAVAGLVVICASSVSSWQTNAADLEISIPIRVTHAQNLDPSPSPDGKKLVFISVISGKEQLFTMDADGKNISQLTRDDADHEDPSWSPDGKKIAFVLITKERTSIAVMNADGSNVEMLTPKEHNNIHPNWSADSKQVMYCTNDDLAPPKKNEAQIDAVDLANKKITPVITGGTNTYGSWSPDMKQIVFRKSSAKRIRRFCSERRRLESAQPYKQSVLRRLARVVAGWKQDRVRIQSPRARLPDFRDGRRRRQSASHRQHRRTRHRAALVAGREANLFHQLRGERLRNGLRDPNGVIRAAAVEGELSLIQTLNTRRRTRTVVAGVSSNS